MSLTRHACSPLRLLYLQALILVCSLISSSAPSQEPLPTVAESSNYERTASHGEVLDYLSALKMRGAPLHLEDIGSTPHGRALRLAIVSIPPITSPTEAHRLGRPIVFLQGNIHAGEVCGKEAILALLRDLTDSPEGQALLRQIVLLALPNYNPDGNDSLGPVDRNRRGQQGPAEVGLRPNAQGLDLNRDYMKAESPECRSVLANVLNTWDPDVFIDCHTTNGSYHGYQLTYAPSLQPVPAEAPTRFVRDELLPAVRQSVRKRGFEIFDYGNCERRDPKTWRTYDHRPRFGTNYMALRGRMGILSEAYSYAPFKTRIDVTYAFVHEILKFVAANGVRIRDIHRATDSLIRRFGEEPDKAPPLGVEFEIAARQEPVKLLIDTPTQKTDEEGRRLRGPAGNPSMIEMTVYDRFEVKRSLPYPAGFLLPSFMTKTVAELERHGIHVERLLQDVEAEVEWTLATKAFEARRPFQGHHLKSIQATRERARGHFPKGSFYVPLDQRLGMLAFYLLEPDYDDGLLAWEKLDGTLQTGKRLPHAKVYEPPSAARVRVLPR